MLNPGCAGDPDPVLQAQGRAGGVEKRGASITAGHGGGRCAWAVLRRAVDIQGGGRAAVHQLSFPGRLRGPGRAQRVDHHAALPAQAEVPAADPADKGEPRAQGDHAKLRLLHGVPEQVRQHRCVGAVH